MKTRCPHLPFSIEKEACLDCGEEMSEKYRRCNPALRDTVVKKKDTDLPEFSAEHLNLLSQMATRVSKLDRKYYVKSKKFVEDYLDGKEMTTEKQRKWLWGIWRELDELQNE